MKYFVFVVCGSREHVDTLNFSLKFVRRFSNYPILVITDSSRNECKIEYDKIIDIKTPEHFNHHQASIYLKTGIHKFLDMSENKIYCYLDSDVVAINSDINKIFDNYTAPINFASDHCNISEFSPFSVNCSCLNEHVQTKQLFNDKLSMVLGEVDLANPILIKQTNELLNVFNTWKRKPLVNIFKIIRYIFARYILPVKHVHIKHYILIKSKKYWVNKDNDVILFDLAYYKDKLWEISKIYYDKKIKSWIDDKGKIYSFDAPKCTHLVDYLKNNYEVEIPTDWQHWNGGVFLFNHQSKEFLDFWHETTIKEFENPYTKTRDQFTLAMSAWKFGLQNHSRLDKKYNFITEFADENIAYKEGLGFTYNNFKSVFEPCFLHIYHEWGRKGWCIWDYVEKIKLL